MNGSMEKEIFEIYIEDIIPNRFQPRLTFDENALQELAESIKQHGFIQPLVLRKVGDKYEIIAGERRYKAACMIGLKKVPAIIMNMDDNESAEVAVVENLQRRDLTALEEAKSYKKLLDKGYLTQEQLASRMGKTQATVSNKLRLLNLDEEVQDALLKEKISERHARSLLSLKNPYDQRELLNQIINNKLTVRQTDDLIKSKTGIDVANTPINNPIDNIPINIPIESTPINKPVEINPINNINETIIEDVPITAPSTPTLQPEERIIPEVTESKEEMVSPAIGGLNEEDIRRLKEETTDITPVVNIPNIDNLLSSNNEVPHEVKPIDNSPPLVEQENVEQPKENKFINVPFDEEVTNMNINDILKPAPIFTPNIDIKPQEAKSVENTNIGENKIEPANSIVNNVPNVTKSTDLKSAINNVRDAVKVLENNGFIVDLEEFDFEHLYQMIIKINK